MHAIRTSIATLAAAVLMGLAGCASTPDTRIPAAQGRAPLATLLVLIDQDVIASAFTAYKASAPTLARPATLETFIGQLVAGCLAEAKAAGVEASAEVVSQKAIQAGATPAIRGNAVLTLRATSYGTRKEGTRDGIWNGDTAWEFILSERSANNPYKKTWAAGVRSENFDPASCGNYRGCGRALAGKLFAQMRKDGVVR